MSEDQCYEQIQLCDIFQGNNNHSSDCEPNGLKITDNRQHINQDSNDRKPKQKSKHQYQYNTYFQPFLEEVQKKFASVVNNKQYLMQNNIQIINDDYWNQNKDLISYKKPSIFRRKTQHLGTVIHYTIIVANFKLNVKLLNLDDQSPSGLVNLGSGSYGNIFQINIGNQTPIIAKRIKYRYMTQVFCKQEDQQEQYADGTKDQLQLFLCEFAIYKICSVFRIGPKMQNFLGFDLIAYFDSIQFFMQECINLNLRSIERYQHKKFKNNISVALRLLHKLKIIHKDIKPDNILFSTTYNEYVLSDFGISHPVQQDVGYKSMTHLEGTVKYMSQQMKNILPDNKQPTKIDLYYNDLYGLRLILNSCLGTKKLKIIKNQKKLEEKAHNQFYVFVKVFSFLIDEITKDIGLYLNLISEQYIIDTIKSIQGLDLDQIIQNIRYAIESKNLNDFLKNQLISLKLKIQQIDKSTSKVVSILHLVKIYGIHFDFIDILSKIQGCETATKLMIKLQKIKLEKFSVKRLLQESQVNSFFKTFKQQMKLLIAYQKEFKKNQIKKPEKLIPMLQQLLNILFQNVYIPMEKNFLNQLEQKLNKYKSASIATELQLYNFIKKVKMLGKFDDIDQKQIESLQNKLLVDPVKITTTKYLLYIYKFYEDNNRLVEYSNKILQRLDQINLINQQTIQKNINERFRETLIFFKYFILMDLKNFTQAQTLIKRILSYLDSTQSKQNPFYIRYSILLSNNYKIQQKYEQALNGYLNIVKIIEYVFDKNNCNIYFVYYEIGTLYMNQYKNKLAIHWFKKCLNMLDNQYESFYLNIYLTIAQCYINLFEERKAQQMIEKYIQLHQLQPNSSECNKAERLQALFLLLVRKMNNKKFQEAINCLKKAQQIIQKQGCNNRLLICEFYIHSAILNIEIKNIQKSMITFYKCSQIINSFPQSQDKQIKNQLDILKFKYYFRIGKFYYIQLMDYQSSLSEFQKCKKLSESIGPVNLYIYQLYFFLGNIYARKNNIEAAISNFNQAYNIILIFQQDILINLSKPIDKNLIESFQKNKKQLIKGLLRQYAKINSVDRVIQFSQNIYENSKIYMQSSDETEQIYYIQNIYHLAENYLKVGKYNQAIQFYQIFLQNCKSYQFRKNSEKQYCQRIWYIQGNQKLYQCYHQIKQQQIALNYLLQIFKIPLDKQNVTSFDFLKNYYEFCQKANKIDFCMYYCVKYLHMKSAHTSKQFMELIERAIKFTKNRRILKIYDQQKIQQFKQQNELTIAYQKIKNFYQSKKQTLNLCVLVLKNQRFFQYLLSKIPNSKYKKVLKCVYLNLNPSHKQNELFEALRITKRIVYHVKKNKTKFINNYHNQINLYNQITNIRQFLQKKN